MPPKKKGKKKKPLTDEEKAKQAEMKALAEKEKLVRRKRLTHAYLHLKKEKEYELIKLNDNKLLDLWRPRLRKLKCNEILEDYKMMQAAFERNFRKKDELLADLDDVMRQNDEEYDNAFDMHLNNIDQILEFYHNRLNEVRGMYAQQKSKLLTVLNNEKFQMQSYQEKSLRYLNGVMTAVNMHYRELASDSKAELFIRQEEIRNKALEETHAAKQETDKRMKAVWDDIQNLLVEYDTKITPLRNEFQELRKKDDLVVATIDSQFRKMYKLQTGIESLAEKDRNYCKAFQKFIEELMGKRDELKAQYMLQQQRFDSVAKTGKSNIRQLALLSGMVLEIQWVFQGEEGRFGSQMSSGQKVQLDLKAPKGLDMLDKIKCPAAGRANVCQASRSALKVKTLLESTSIESMINQRERLMKCIERCRKRERLDEKVDPFMLRWGLQELQGTKRNDSADPTASLYAPSSAEPGGDGLNLIPKKIEHNIQCECNPCTCAVDEEATDSVPITTSVTEFSLLERFWIRFNRACLERRLLSQRRESMMKDNYQLKLALRNYMGGLNPLQHSVATYSDGLMSTAQRNYQLVVRGMIREWKRRERCKKVGGLRVH